MKIHTRATHPASEFKWRLIWQRVSARRHEKWLVRSETPPISAKRHSLPQDTA